MPLTLPEVHAVENEALWRAIATLHELTASLLAIRVRHLQRQRTYEILKTFKYEAIAAVVEDARLAPLYEAAFANAMRKKGVGV